MNLTNIKYRKATIKDAKILAAYRVRFLNEVYHIETHLKSNELTNELTTYFTETTLNNSVISWLAIHNKKIIATSTIVIWQVPMSYNNILSKGKRSYILNMYTLKKFRKNGITSRLLENLITEAKNLNLALVNLHATNDGIGVYKKLDFNEPKFPELILKIKE